MEDHVGLDGITYRTVRFRVEGIPGPQGSKSYKGLRGGKPILVESSKKVGPWREAVAAAAYNAMRGRRPFTGPLIVGFSFSFIRPPSHLNAKGDLTKNAPRMHTTYPDLSKLVRSTEDALKGIVWTDDSHVVGYEPTRKVYGDWSGCLLVVREIVLPDP